MATTTHSFLHKIIDADLGEFGDELFSAEHRENLPVHLQTIGGHDLASDHVAVIGKGIDDRSKTGVDLDGRLPKTQTIHAVALRIAGKETKDIRKGSLWLGYSHLTTTEVYVRADPTEKLEVMEAVVPPSLRRGKFRPPDKLLALLKAKP